MESHGFRGLTRSARSCATDTTDERAELCQGGACVHARDLPSWAISNVTSFCDCDCPGLVPALSSLASGTSASRRSEGLLVADHGRTRGANEGQLCLRAGVRRAGMGRSPRYAVMTSGCIVTRFTCSPAAPEAPSGATREPRLNASSPSCPGSSPGRWRSRG
jgi:hypothetical protein